MVAVRQILRSDVELAKTIIKQASDLKHTNILEYFDIIEQNDKLYLTSEMPIGSLNDVI